MTDCYFRPKAGVAKALIWTTIQQGRRKTVRRVIAIIVCVVFLGGCVPIIESYYEPSSTNGTLFGDMCHSGPKSNVSFTLGDATLRVHSRFEPHADGEYSVDVQLGLRHEDAGEVAWNDMKVSQMNGTSIPFASDTYAYNLPFTSADMPNHHMIESDAVDGKSFSFYEYVVKLNSPLPDEFMFTIPTMTINGVVYPSFEVKFVKKSGFWIVPLNC